jgi:hypothetical protein
MLPTKFRFTTSFGQTASEKSFLEINQSEARIAYGGHVY